MLMPDSVDSLERFRREIDDLDRAIVHTIARRLRMCTEVARFKQSHGVPMMQPQRINEVRERVAAAAAEHGLRPEFVVELYSLIIGEACRLEDQLMRACPGVAPDVSLGRVTIVGAAGGIAALFVRALRDEAVTVCGVDLRPPADAALFDSFYIADAGRPAPAAVEALRSSDCVILATPPAAALDMAARIVGCLRPGALLVDTLSIKLPIARLMASLNPRCEWLSLNPMFGPAAGFRGHNVVAVGTPQGELTAAFVAKLESWGARVTFMTAEEHDRSCALIQAATHFVILSFGMAIGSAERQVNDLIDAASPPFRACLALLARTLAGDPELYWDIQAGNEFAAAARRMLLAGAADLDAAVRKQDQGQFTRTLDGLRDSLGPYLAPLRARSDALVAVLRDAGEPE
jgi:chorismate mutase-like protein